MPISYIYSGNPENGTAGDDFIEGWQPGTGTDNNTINAGDGDDLVIADIGDFYIPSAATTNDSIANAFNLETAADAWTTSENEMFANWSIPHATVIAEATVGQAEYYSVSVGAGETLTVDIDLGSSAVGVPRDLVVEIRDGAGNVLATDDDSFTTEGGAGSTSSLDPYLTFTAPSSGTYYISVHPFSGSTFTENNTFVMNVSVTGHSTVAATTQGNDIIDGGTGDDVIFGQGGADTITGGIGDDYIDGGTGADNISGGDGNDTLSAGPDDFFDDGASNTIHGDGGNDVIYSNGYGLYYGDEGDDVMHAGLGTGETLDGGNGTDTIDTSSYSGAYVLDLVTGNTNFSGESYINFENAVTGGGSDNVTGTDDANVISTNNGNDTISGLGGDDTLNGGSGNDSIDGGSGLDTISGGDGDDTLSGGDESDTTANVVHGNAGNDTIYSTGDGSYYGDEDNDLIVAGLTSFFETLDGGAGVDTVDTTSYTGSYNFDMATGSTGYAESFVNFENAITGAGSDNVSGTSADNSIWTNAGADTLNGLDGNDYLNGGADNDTLQGGNGVDVLDGGAGNDILNGGAGTDTASFESATAFVVVNLGTQGVAQNTRQGMDTLIGIERLIGSNYNDQLTGGTGNDRLEGGLGNDFMVGNAGNDTFFGGDGDDRMEGGAGDDILNGNTGRDTAIYSSATSGVIVNLSVTTAQNTVGAGNDTLNSIERLIGSNFNDSLSGNTSNNVIYGEGGNDVISAGAGSDVIYGGTGNDSLTGGAGQDSFMFDTALNAATNVDQIQDFTVNYDKIRLDSSIFTQAGALGTLDANAFHAGLTAGDASDRIIYDSTTGNIYYDADGNGGGAQVLFAHVTAGTALTSSDFIVI